jgi:AraC-like DNA-binding protein
MLRDSPVIVAELPSYGFLYFRSLHSETFSMEMAVWNFHKICWVESGSGSLQYEDKDISFSQDDILLIAPNVKHRFIDNKGTPSTLSMVCYNEEKIPDQFIQLHQSLLNCSRSLTIFDPWRRDFLKNHFRKSLIEQSRKSKFYKELISAEFIQLLVFLTRAIDQIQDSSSNEKLIEGLRDYLKENFTKDNGIEELAALCSMSSRSLSRHFKDFTGTTIVKFITELRINYACERLKETHQISFSASDAGFNDLSFFYRVFKKHTGMTPKNYIKELK